MFQASPALLARAAKTCILVRRQQHFRSLHSLVCAQGNTPTGKGRRSFDQSNTPTGKGRRSFDQGNRPLSHAPSSLASAHPPSPLSRSSVPLTTAANQSSTPSLALASRANPEDAGLSPGSSAPFAEAPGATRDIYETSHAAISRAEHLAVGGKTQMGVGSLAITVPTCSATADTQKPAAASTSAATPASVPAAATASVPASATASAAPSVSGSVRHSEAAGGAEAPAFTALITVVESVPPPITADVERRLKVTQHHCLG